MTGDREWDGADKWEEMMEFDNIAENNEAGYKAVYELENK